jgi:DNA-binding response OmpR family regulator
MHTATAAGSNATPSIGSSAQSAVVLVAEESETERSFLAENLAADGYTVRVADSREKALAVLATVPPVEIAVIDVNGQTLAVIDAVRNGTGLAGQIDPQVPIVALTSRVEELHRIRLLDRGGDDVLAKPYSYPELRARIAAVLRRADARRSPRLLRAGKLTVDLTATTARVGERTLDLTNTERRLLRTLAAEHPRVLTRAELLRMVWSRTDHSTRTVDTHVHRLRRKLASAGSDAWIELVWGLGYRLTLPDDAG